jgi:hypothetical protein
LENKKNVYFNSSVYLNVLKRKPLSPDLEIKFITNRVYIMWWPAGRHIIYTQPHTTQNFINQKPKLSCNSEGTDELPEDGTQFPKRVGAAK